MQAARNQLDIGNLELAMKTYTASIFVELEIKVSGTLTEGCRESHDPPSPAEPSRWEDVAVDEILHRDTSLLRLQFGYVRSTSRDLLFGEFLTNLKREFSDEIESALSAEVPDGPNPDDQRDARIDARLMGDD